MNDTQLKLILLAVIAPLLILIVELKGRKDEKAADRPVATWKLRVPLYVFAFSLVVLLILNPRAEWPLVVAGAVFSAGVVVLLFLGFVFLSYRISTGNKVLAEAQALYDEGRLDDAVALLRTKADEFAAKNNVFAAAALFNIARYETNRGNFEIALDALQRAGNHHDLGTAAIGLRAEIVREQGDPEACLRMLRDAGERFPKSVHLHTELAKAHWALRDAPAASTALDRAEELLRTERSVDVADKQSYREESIRPLRQQIADAEGSMNV